MPRSIRSQAVEKYVVRHNGRGIHVYQMPVPGLHAQLLSQEVLALAAERAYKRGWRKIVLTWADMPCSTCFETGYAYLLALNCAMAREADSHYRISEELCRIGRDGDVFNPPPASESFYDYERDYL